MKVKELIDSLSKIVADYPYYNDFDITTETISGNIQQLDSIMHHSTYISDERYASLMLNFKDVDKTTPSNKDYGLSLCDIAIIFFENIKESLTEKRAKR